MHQRSMPLTEAEIYKRRALRHRQELEAIRVRRKRKFILRWMLIFGALVLIVVHFLDPNLVIAGGTIWACIGGE